MRPSQKMTPTAKCRCNIGCVLCDCARLYIIAMHLSCSFVNVYMICDHVHVHIPTTSAKCCQFCGFPAKLGKSAGKLSELLHAMQALIPTSCSMMASALDVSKTKQHTFEMTIKY